MRIDQGEKVMTADGEVVGEIYRVVLDPKTKEVTHIVVKEGFLFAEERVVPIDLVEYSGEDQVKLRDIPVDYNELPCDYKEFSLLYRVDARGAKFYVEVDTDPNMDPIDILRVDAKKNSDYFAMHCNEKLGRGLWEAFQEFGFTIMEMRETA